jgi:hypothetical protein
LSGNKGYVESAFRDACRTSCLDPIRGFPTLNKFSQWHQLIDIITVHKLYVHGGVVQATVKYAKLLEEQNETQNETKFK